MSQQTTLDEMAAIIGYQMVENRMLRRQNAELAAANKQLSEQAQNLLKRVQALSENPHGD